MANTEKVQIDLELKAEKLSQGVQESISRIEALEKSFEKLGKTGNNTGKDIDERMQSMTKGFDALTKVGKVMTTAVTLPLLGFATASTKTAMDFERAMAEVSAISGSTGKDLERLEKHARELGSTTEFSASQAAEGMKYFALI